ncbi:alpha/beta hydrolase [Parasphingopyxis sp. CP4]|uniref:alpha/beta hydrolase n=1 Tax=Parasphingopyxis sp. CP4 TaxID=2724527 RepID=UPI0015A4C3B0|nr:alpha/beta hydrolase-fold protein [Parasphingopyxis sp. CP4]QLC21161.1 alpha/beta hydrolase [Parasphingopyxis sp. CP4]
MRIACAILGVAAAALAAPAAAQDLTPLDWNRAASPVQSTDREEELAVESLVIGESREITVRLPASYSETQDRYPVFYVTDADWNYRIVADYVDYLSYWGRIPETIVVGIRNVDRNRDFVPRPSASFPNSGEADAFRDFLTDELKPMIDGRYRTSGFNTLFGHSFGGVITAYVMMTRPDAFESYIALSTSTWVSGRFLFEEAERFFAAPEYPELFYYMAVAEADGGATVPDGNAFAEMFEARAPDSIEWHYSVVPRTNHFSVVMPAFADAIERLYPAWGFDTALQERIETDGATAINSWFAEREAELGPRFYPQAMELGLLGIRLAAAGEADAARALFARVHREHPDNAETAFMNALAENALGDRAAAIHWTAEAYRVGRATGDVMPHRLTTYRNFGERWTQAAEQEAEAE